MESEARFLYFNSSSTATSLTLLGALILLGVIFYLLSEAPNTAATVRTTPTGDTATRTRLGMQSCVTVYLSKSVTYQATTQRHATHHAKPTLQAPQIQTNLISPTSHASSLPLPPPGHPSPSTTQPESS